jgi:hypothetical protein
MSNWIDEQIQKQRFADMIHTAERDRLRRLVLAVQPRRPRFSNRVLASLGRRLVVWGCSLQLHYDLIIEAPIASKTRGNVSRC